MTVKVREHTINLSPTIALRMTNLTSSRGGRFCFVLLPQSHGSPMLLCAVDFPCLLGVDTMSTNRFHKLRKYAMRTIMYRTFNSRTVLGPPYYLWPHYIPICDRRSS